MLFSLLPALNLHCSRGIFRICFFHAVFVLLRVLFYGSLKPAVFRPGGPEQPVYGSYSYPRARRADRCRRILPRHILLPADRPVSISAISFLTASSSDRRASALLTSACLSISRPLPGQDACTAGRVAFPPVRISGGRPVKQDLRRTLRPRPPPRPPKTPPGRKPPPAPRPGSESDVPGMPYPAQRPALRPVMAPAPAGPV